MSYTSSGGCNSFLSDDHDPKMLDRVREKVEGRNLVGIVILEFWEWDSGPRSLSRMSGRKDQPTRHAMISLMLYSTAT